MNTTSQDYIGAPNGIVLCVDCVKDHDFSGRMYHGFNFGATTVPSGDVLIFQMEQLYDAMCFPRKGTENRSFVKETKTMVNLITEKDRVMSDNELLEKHGDMGTFIIRVQHRQNSSWQGRITWTEKNKTLNFRSIWEMVRLIYSALKITGTSEEEPDVDWEQKE